MKVYETKNIRNIALLGHAGTGKTTFIESALFCTGAINRKGTVEDGNTVSDFHPLEKERTCSIFNAPLFVEHGGKKLNIIDSPGYDDYIGEAISAIRVADSSMIFINAQNGLEVGTESAWEYSEKENNPVMFGINKIDVDQAEYDKTFEEIKTRFGASVTMLQFPNASGAGFESVIDILSMKQYTFKKNDPKPQIADIPGEFQEKADNLRNELVESIAESDEDLMNKYLEEGELSEEELNDGIKKALVAREFMPVFAFSTKNDFGTIPFLDFLVKAAPAPDEVAPAKTVEGEDIACDSMLKPSMYIFKMLSEAHLGDMTFFKAMTGQIKAGLDLINHRKNSSERLNQIFVIEGKKRAEVDAVNAGDIAATVKLKTTAINDSLHEKGNDIEFPDMVYPNPKVRIAVAPETKGEEEKVGMGLNAIHQEDPSLVVNHSQELRQMILFGQGEQHLGIAKWKLENKFKVKTKFIEPRVPYRETIQKQVTGSYRHKKQSGGAGQFAEVHMLIEPWSEDAPYKDGVPIRGKDLHELDWGGKLEYVNSIVGGVIDQRFLPAILKGVMEKMTFGPLTGSYVRDIRVQIYDGKMHPVDSNEAAFKTAGMMVFKDLFKQANPKILEPIYDVSVKAPEEFVGDIMSDLPTRRGLILGVDAEGRYQVVKAKMPLAELDKYATALRSMTQGKATYSSEYAEYQTVPANVQQELIAAYQKSLEEE